MNNEDNITLTDRLARILSFIFHPLFMPLYGLVILMSAPTFLKYLPPAAKRVLFLVVLVNNVLIPLLLLPFLKMRNFISSYHLEDRRERIIPTLTASMLYFTTSFIVLRYQIPFFLKSFIFATAVLSIVVSMINFWWKISIHAAGAGALTATVSSLWVKMYTPLPWYLLAALVASGFILAARLKLNSHDPLQVWTGYLTGFLIIILFVLLI
ncbi:MAG TPA: hypothetical protein DCY25_04670 [Bacteroidales bacterium]|nr:hypothetical protein [Bacteroidales bacterium]